MPRIVKFRTLAGAQRQLRGLHSVAPRVQGNNTATPPPAQYPCPYCTFWTTNESGRARHILGTPSCRRAQAADVEKARVAHQAARRVGLRLPLLAGLTQEDAIGADEEPMPWVRIDNPFVHSGDAPVPGSPVPTSPPTDAANDGAVAQNPEDGGRAGSTSQEGANGANSDADGEVDGEIGEGGEGGEGSEGGEGDGFDDECGQVHVEGYPDQRAGQPINGRRVEPLDLREYMRARGDFSNVVYFDIAKTLMTTKLTNVGRDVHLKSRAVSSL